MSVYAGLLSCTVVCCFLGWWPAPPAHSLGRGPGVKHFSSSSSLASGALWKKYDLVVWRDVPLPLFFNQTTKLACWLFTELRKVHRKRVGPQASKLGSELLSLKRRLRLQQASPAAPHGRLSHRLSPSPQHHDPRPAAAPPPFPVSCPCPPRCLPAGSPLLPTALTPSLPPALAHSLPPALTPSTASRFHPALASILTPRTCQGLEPAVGPNAGGGSAGEG